MGNLCSACLGRAGAARPPRGPAGPAAARRAARAGAGAGAPDAELARATKGKDFTFAGCRFDAKVVEVYDGDTIRVCFRHGGALVQYKARMAGYDSPELHPLRANPNRAQEMEAARRARDALAARVGGRLVRIDCGAFDKYGRLLITVYEHGPAAAASVNQWMVAQGYGVVYAGGTKTPYGQASPV